MIQKGIDQYANAQTTMCTQYTNNNVIAIESSRKREHKHLTSERSIDCLCSTIKAQNKAHDK